MVTIETEPGPHLGHESFGCYIDKPNGENSLLMQRSSIIFCFFLSSFLLLSACKQAAPTPGGASPEVASQTPLPSASPTPPRPSGPIEFTDVSAQAGIRFKHHTGAFGKKYLPETLGTGGAFL